MNVTTALDYLYYRISWWNTHVVKDNSFLAMSNVFGVSALHSMNLFTIAGLFFPIFYPGFKMPSNTIQIISISTIIASNYFYFIHNKRHDNIIDYCSAIPKENKWIYDIFIIAYILCTLVLMIATIVIGRIHHAS